jgi:tRNA(fMet)-specific endonuclease VapC
VEEQLSGWYSRLRQAKRSEELARIYQKLSRSVDSLVQFHILTFDEPCIAHYEHLKSLKLNVGKMDLRIAAIVLENGGVLVTRNLRDFQRVPGLILEDWSR